MSPDALPYSEYVARGFTRVVIGNAVVYVAPPSYYEPTIRHREERAASRKRAPAAVNPSYHLNPKKPEA